MRIQSNLASTIAMAFDECIENPSTREYTARSIARTVRWLERCKKEMQRLNSLPETINKNSCSSASIRDRPLRICASST